MSERARTTAFNTSETLCLSAKHLLVAFGDDPSNVKEIQVTNMIKKINDRLSPTLVSEYCQGFSSAQKDHKGTLILTELRQLNAKFSKVRTGNRKQEK